MARRTRMAVFSLLFLLSIVPPFSLPPLDSATAQDQKMTIEILVARHLEAIGTSDARAKVASRVASGKSNFLVRLGGSTNLDGSAMMVSTGPKIRFGMRFPAPDYPGEDLAFDGNRAATAMLPQGGRSGLSRFLESQNLPLKEGLLGGALSTTWPLLRMNESQPRLEYRGLKKIDDRQLHEVNYRARRRERSESLALLRSANIPPRPHQIRLRGRGDDRNERDGECQSGELLLADRGFRRFSRG